MNWKKLVAAAVAAVVAFGVLELFAALVSPHWVYVLFAVALGYLAYTKWALWEIEAMMKKAQDVVK